jgi:hypothetical protein
MVNEAAEKTNGTVVCIEKGVGLRFDIKHSVRLINTNEYLVFDAEALYGFVAGILASNHDVTDLFIDGALKISNNDVAAFEAFLKELDELISKLDVNVVLTSSIPVEEASDTVKKYL